MKSLKKLSSTGSPVHFLLVLCSVILASNFLPRELSSPFIVLLGLSIMSFDKIQRSYLKLVWPLIGVLVIGVVGVFGHDSRHIVRDIAFALMPIALVFIGYWMAKYKNMQPSIFNGLMVCAYVLAINHLAAFVASPELLHANVEEVRATAGRGTGGLVALCLALILFQYRFRVRNVFPKRLYLIIALPLFIASFVLSYSRTESLMFLVLLLSLWGFLSRLKLTTTLGLSILFMAASSIVLTTPDDEQGTLRSKFARSLTEISAVDSHDYQSINDNWRAYETARVFASIKSSTPLEQLFGQGFGAVADLGLYMNLGGEDFREIPIFHNGYAYILIKTGLLGLLCYAIFYIYLIRYAVRYSNSLNLEQRFMARLLLGCVLSLILMMYVVGGMAEAAGSVFVLLIGYLVRRISQLQTEVAHPDLTGGT